MTRSERDLLTNPLQAQLRWFVRLRWLAGSAVVAVALLDWLWWDLYQGHTRFVGIGAAILLYNTGLWAWLRGGGDPSERLVLGAWVQILLDLACLTMLTLWTGGAASPLLAFYVFHMVFASLLLPGQLSYGSAAVAIAMVLGGLAVAGQWPGNLDVALPLAGWMVALVLIVYLANEITRNIQRQWRRLDTQNQRIRTMSRRLRLQQQAMIQQEKMAAVGQMAAGVAHEISNPLASMDSVLQLVGRRPERLDDKTVARLREQVARINGIIRQMRTFSHPAETESRRISSADVLADAVQMVELDRRFKRVQFEQDDAAGCDVQVQPEALLQVLVNLMLNALDAMEDTEDARLIVRVRHEGPRCMIDVIDNGHGIEPDHVERLFEPFFTTKPVGRGTGLGLSISYSLISKQGGRIEVSSAPGEGSTFTIVLPTADALADAAESEPRPDEDAEAEIP